MSRARRLGLAAALLMGVAPAAAAGPDLRIHYPPDNLVVSGDGGLSIVAEIEPGAPGSWMQVRVVGGPGPPAPLARAGGGSVFHGRVGLRAGLNTLEIAFGHGAPPGRVVTRRVFLVFPLAGEWEPPAGFARAPFHGAAAAAACAGCHPARQEVADGGPPAPGRSPCFSCHARVARASEVHGPVAAWACTRCHDPGVRYATPSPVMPLCFSCHAEQKDRFYGSPFQHGPTATGHCTICHSPHGSDQPFFVKKAVLDLCTTCHFEKASGRHVIAWGPAGQGHPTSGKPDPTRPGRELSCASCHNPHAAPSPRLWNFGATLWLDLCRQCHRSILGG